MYLIKIKDDPVRLFLNGSARGYNHQCFVTLLSKKNCQDYMYDLYETLIRYLNSIAGKNPDHVKVVKVAPSYCKRQHIVNYIFLPIEVLSTEDSVRLNTIRAQQCNFIFFCEISMAGSSIFSF